MFLFGTGSSLLRAASDLHVLTLRAPTAALLQCARNGHLSSESARRARAPFEGRCSLLPFRHCLGASNLVRLGFLPFSHGQIPPVGTITIIIIILSAAHPFECGRALQVRATLFLC